MTDPHRPPENETATQRLFPNHPGATLHDLWLAMLRDWVFYRVTLIQFYDWLVVVGHLFKCVGVALCKQLGRCRECHAPAVCCGESVLDFLQDVRRSVREERLHVTKQKRKDATWILDNVYDWFTNLW